MYLDVRMFRCLSWNTRQKHMIFCSAGISPVQPQSCILEVHELSAVDCVCVAGSTCLMTTVRSAERTESSTSSTSWLRSSTTTPAPGPGPNAAANTSQTSWSRSQCHLCMPLYQREVLSFKSLKTSFGSNL